MIFNLFQRRDISRRDSRQHSVASEQLSLTQDFYSVRAFFESNKRQPWQWHRNFNRLKRIIALNGNFGLKQRSIGMQVDVADFKRFPFGQFGHAEIKIRRTRLDKILNRLWLCDRFVSFTRRVSRSSAGMTAGMAPRIAADGTMTRSGPASTPVRHVLMRGRLSIGSKENC